MLGIIVPYFLLGNRAVCESETDIRTRISFTHHVQPECKFVLV